MRIYRDTRFAKDKRPYKTNIGIQLRHEGGDDVHAPGIYVHVATDGSFVGVGLWMPAPPSLDAIRRRIVNEPTLFRDIVAAPAFTRTFARHDHQGGSLKRPPKGFPADHPLVEELKRKSHIASAALSAGDVVSARLDTLIAERLEAGLDYLKFLCDAVGATL